MNKQKFQKSLQSLSSWRERAFIVSLAERALPNAMLYLGNLNEEIPSELEAMLHAIWQHLIIEPDETEIINLLDEVIAHLPEEDESDSYGALPATDCLSLLEQALLSGVNEEKRRGHDASQSSVNTIIQFIEFSEGDGLSENALIKLFDSHPLVAREFSFQSEVNDLLRSGTHPGDALIFELRALAQDEGISNIGISLN